MPGLVFPIHYKGIGNHLLVTNVVAVCSLQAVDSRGCSVVLEGSKGVERMGHVRNKKGRVENGYYNFLRCNPAAASLQWD